MSSHDLFLSYHSPDREAVQTAKRLLEARGVTTFLDREDLVPGLPWPQALEDVLRSVRAVAVFLGPHGFGLWQKREMWFSLDRQVQEEKVGHTFPVIPVLLPGADPTAGFLFLNTWVDLRRDLTDPEALDALARAVLGEEPVPPAKLPVALCPYRGLRPFREEDAAFFFGREAFAQRLVDTVLRRNLVAVVGPSGSGKSSVVQAGLLPLLRRQRPPAATWDAALFTPGDRPFHRLAASLIPLLEPDLSETDRLAEARKLGDRLASGEVLLEDAVERLLAKSRGTDRVLLVPDQLEELFTLTPEADRKPFVEALLRALDRAPLSLLLTLWADFYGHAIASSRELSDRMEQGVINLGPMTYGELEGAIVKPAWRVGLGFEPGLVARILDDVGDEPGNLPLLEFALTELWARRRDRLLTHAAYEDIGEVAGAIAQRAEAVFEAFTPEQQAIAQRLFTRLVRVARSEEGAEDTRQRIALAELDEEARPVVKVLADARLVVTGRDEATGEETVEVAHEALIRGWEQLRRWLDEDREFLLWRQRLVVAQRTWEETERDEGVLLRGAPLAEAEGWLATRGDDLNEAERAFIKTAAARARRVRHLTVGGVAFGFLMVSLLALLFWLQRGVALEAMAAAVAEAVARATAQAQAEVRRQEAEAAQAEAEARRQEAEKQRQIALSRQLAAQALIHLDDHLDLALLLGLEANRITDTVEVRGSLLDGLQYSPHLTTFLRGHTYWVNSVAFSPDGETLASASWDNTIILWNVATHQPLGRPLTGHTAPVLSVAFDPDGKTLVSGSGDNTIILWDVATRQPLGQPLAGHSDGVLSVAFSPNGKNLASGSEDNTIILWDVTSRQPLGQPLTGHSDSVMSVAFSPNGKNLASASCGQFNSETRLCNQGEIRLWDVATHQSLSQPLTGHTASVGSVAFSPDGRTLASGSFDKSIILWDVATRQPLGQPLTGHTSLVLSVAFGLDGKTLVSGSGDNTIILWDVATRQPLGQPLTGHSDRVLSVAFSSNGKNLASGSKDNTIVLWDIAAHQRLGQPLTGHTDWVKSAAFGPDGQTLASGSFDKSIILWDVVTHQPLGQPFIGHTAHVNSVAFSPDGRTLASGGGDYTIILWDVATHQRLGQPFIGHTGHVNSVAFSPDGQMLASGSNDGTIILWDVATRQRLGQPLTGHNDRVLSVAFSPDGRTLASGGGDYTTILWDVATRQRLGQPLTGHTSWVWSIAFSPDGQTLASGSSDGKIILWDVAVRQPFGQPLTGHTSIVYTVAFSSDSKTLASGSGDHTIILWDVATRQRLGQLPTGHADEVWGVAFSPDGQLLASGSKDNTIMLWDVSFGSWQARACTMVNRNLTREEWRQYIGDEPYRPTCPNLPVREE